MNTDYQSAFDQALKQAQLRSTAVRREVFSCLAQASDPLSIQEIISYINRAHFVSVYRTLDTFVRIGVLKRVPIGLKYKYELSDAFKPHHHHVTCEECGRSISVEDSEVEALMEKLTVGADMRPTRHTFEAYGICSRH